MKKTGAREKTKLTDSSQDWLKEDQNDIEIGSSDVKGLLVGEQNQIVATATTAEPTIEQPPPKIFKLDIDCFDEIFARGYCT